ncbi:MAG: Lrp/AsnC ligand binding domain-containing protein, partial [Bacteroidetes bacterium]|nr:Lrp/AsnC ligand binding domain-containing protein [Bacteroidota bacterium]
GNPFKLGFGIAGNIKITVHLKKVKHVINELKKLNELWYIAQMTGASDLDAEFMVKSFEDLRVLLFDKVNQIDGIIRTETAFLLDYIKNDYEWGTGYNEKK